MKKEKLPIPNGYKQALKSEIKPHNTMKTHQDIINDNELLIHEVDLEMINDEGIEINVVEVPGVD